MSQQSLRGAAYLQLMIVLLRVCAIEPLQSVDTYTVGPLFKFQYWSLYTIAPIQFVKFWTAIERILDFFSMHVLAECNSLFPRYGM